MNIVDILCAWLEVSLLIVLLAVVRWYRRRDDSVIGSEVHTADRSIIGIDFGATQASIVSATVSPDGSIAFGDPVVMDLSMQARAYTGSIADTHLGRAAKSTRADRGHFSTGNQPANTGSSKQIERLHLAGVPHASTVAMMDADCTQQERRVIHMREAGDSLALIAVRLGVSVAKVRRLEAKAVDKIIAARKEPS